MFTNYARTTPRDTANGLRERIYRATPEQVVAALRKVTGKLRRWRFTGYNTATQEIHLEHDTPLITFTDDIVLYLQQEGEDVRVSGYSRSRVGDWDLGMNARNLKRILSKLDRQLGTR